MEKNIFSQPEEKKYSNRKMKNKNKLYLFLAAMLVCGSICAQDHYTFTFSDYAYNMSVVAEIQLNGIEQTSNSIELGAFVDGSVRGSQRITVSEGYYRAWIQVFFNDNDEVSDLGLPVSFEIYDHSTNKSYTNYTANKSVKIRLSNWGNAIDPVILNFAAEQTFTKDISAYTANGGWYLISSPIGDVAPENVTNMCSDNFDLYRFNQSAEKEWENYKNSNNYHFDLNSGKGYLYANSAAVQLKFTGYPEIGNTKEIPVTYDENATLKGMNLIGNPFAEAAYLANAAENGTALAYYKMNNSGDGFTAVEDGTAIPAMEGVFIQTTATGNVYFTKTAPTGAKSASLNITISQDRGSIDNAIIRFGEGNTLEKYCFRENSTKVYIPQNGKDFALVNADNQGEIPVCFKAETNGTYTLNINCENMSMGYLHLIDNLTGNDIDLLATPGYTFNAKTSDYASRFRLVFATGNANDDHFAFYSNSKLIINNDGAATLQIIDINGRILSSESFSGCYSKSIDATTGIYMLRLINGNNTKTQKVIVQ